MALNFERSGAGAPLVLIHGLGGSHLIWGPVLEALAASRDVISVDMPGFGHSPQLADGVAPTAANLGAAIADLLDELGIERAHLAGNSLGGWVALEMAKAGRARTVCAISPAGLWRQPLGPRSFDLRATAARFRPVISALLHSSAARRRMLSTTMARPEKLSAAESRALIGDWLDSPGYDAANAQMRTHVFEDPERVEVPTTIAWAELDRLVGPPRPERMPPGTRYLVLPGCGHTPTWDDPDLVARTLLEAGDAELAAGEAEAALRDPAR